MASAAMGRRLSRDIPQLAVPDPVIDALERDPGAGVAFAVDLIAEIEESGMFDGVHLVPVNWYREVAALLEASRLVTIVTPVRGRGHASFPPRVRKKPA